MPPTTEGGPLFLECKVTFFSARLSRMVNRILPAGVSYQPTFCPARSTANTNVQHSNPADLLERSDFCVSAAIRQNHLGKRAATASTSAGLLYLAASGHQLTESILRQVSQPLSAAHFGLMISGVSTFSARHHPVSPSMTQVSLRAGYPQEETGVVPARERTASSLG